MVKLTEIPGVEGYDGSSPQHRLISVQHLAGSGRDGQRPKESAETLDVSALFQSLAYPRYLLGTKIQDWQLKHEGFCFPLAVLFTSSTASCFMWLFSRSPSRIQTKRQFQSQLMNVRRCREIEMSLCRSDAASVGDTESSRARDYSTRMKIFLRREKTCCPLLCFYWTWQIGCVVSTDACQSLSSVPITRNGA